MNRALVPSALGCLVFAGALMVVLLAVAAGLVPDDTARLWAGATAAGAGEVPVGSIVAAYPTLPFLATTLTSAVTPVAAPAPALVAAAILAMLAVRWLVSFRAAGLGLLVATVTTLLLAFHPALLRALIGGPADMLLALFLFLLAGALYDLRARSTTPEVMAVGLALLGLVFSHPMGAALACAAVPFLVFAVQPALIGRSALNIVVALVFPTVFAVLAFVYVSWVFPGSGWSFFALPGESLAAWSVAIARTFGDGLTGSLALDAGLGFLLALLIGAPLVPLAVWRVRNRRPLVAPVLVLAATIAAAAAVTVATRTFGDPSALALAAPLLAAVAITKMPPVREHRAVMLALLLLGWLGGLAAVALVDPASAGAVRTALEGRAGEPQKLDALAAGGALQKRDGVLVDTENAPAIVLGRGHVPGLLAPPGEVFGLATLFARIDTPYVAVPDPQTPAGQRDRLNRIFPQLYQRGAPGYRLVYQNNTWRIFARDDVWSIYKG